MGSTGQGKVQIVGFQPAGKGQSPDPVRPALNPLGERSAEGSGGGVSPSSPTTGNDPMMVERPGGGGSPSNPTTGGSVLPQSEYAEVSVEEAIISRALRSPIRPSKEERDAPEVSHLPFRSWCSACVRARATAHGHFVQQHDEEQVSTVSMDYMFLGSAPRGQLQGVAATELPVLVVCDRFTKAVAAHPVEHKRYESPR